MYRLPRGNFKMKKIQSQTPNQADQKGPREEKNQIFQKNLWGRYAFLNI